MALLSVTLPAGRQPGRSTARPGSPHGLRLGRAPPRRWHQPGRLGALRRALVDLGVGLWHADPPARAYTAGLRARGKPGGVIATAPTGSPTRWCATKPSTTPIAVVTRRFPNHVEDAMLVGWEAGSDTQPAMADFGYAV
jgi:hypothetical protein